jgi:uncharacterized Tic20 family protein
MRNGGRWMEKKYINNNSTISLIVGILSILVPLFGFFLGVIGIVISRKAIKEIERNNEDGRGFAISGLFCSIIGIILQFFGIVGIIAYYSLTTTKVITF